MGIRRTPRAQAGSWGGPAEPGRGQRDRPLRRRDLRAPGGCARDSSPGAGVAAPAAGGHAAAASAPAAARRRGRGRALRTPLRLQRRSGRRSPSRAGAERPPEPRTRPSPRRAGPPLAQSARSGSAREAPPLQVRARSRRRKVLGGLPVLTPRACASCPPLGFLRAALGRALCSHHQPRGAAATSSPPVPTPGRGACAGSFRACNG